VDLLQASFSRGFIVAVFSQPDRIVDIFQPLLSRQLWHNEVASRNMDISVVQVIVWLIVGTLAGNLTGILIKGRKKGFGQITNIGVGLVGALIGGALFNLLNVDLGLGELSISFQDLVAAFLGSLIFLVAIWLARRRFS
jgi:uncharacterized membrane protein YeaQ/YmgE (transglycosylase-associated protein family)